MTPSSIVLRRYRSFANQVKLQLRPITLLFGVNNSGKSALLRAIPLIADSLVSDIRSPIDLQSEALGGGGIQALQWSGISSEEDKSVRFGFEWDGDPYLSSASVGVRQFPEWKRLIVDELELNGDIDHSLRVAWKPLRDEQRSRKLSYERLPEHTEFGKIEFDGLVPALETHPGMRLYAKRLRDSFLHQVQWLRAVRMSPGRAVRVDHVESWNMKPNGVDAAQILAGNPDILEEVSDWYSKSIRRRLRLAPATEADPNLVRLLLQPLSAEHSVDLVDSGEGILQALPILTALSAAARWQSGGPRILALEEPESHLNPKLQRALAERIATVAAGGSPPIMVIETHSPHLLAAIQLLIAAKDNPLPSSSVAIYWVWQDDQGRSHTERVHLDEDARLQGAWPQDAFSDLSKMARQLLNLRRTRD